MENCWSPSKVCRYLRMQLIFPSCLFLSSPNKANDPESPNTQDSSGRFTQLTNVSKWLMGHNCTWCISGSLRTLVPVGVSSSYLQVLSHDRTSRPFPSRSQLLVTVIRQAGRWPWAPHVMVQQKPHAAWHLWTLGHKYYRRKRGTDFRGAQVPKK